MSNDINMKFSLESQEDLSFKSGPLLSDDDFEFNSLNPYQYTDKEVKIKSISANGTPIEPDENKNVDIPLATTKTEWGPVYDEEWGEEIYTQKEVAGDAGLMSGEEKLKLKQIEEKAQVNKLEKIKLGDEEASVKNKTVEIPYAKAQEPEVSTGIGQLEYFGGLMSGEDKEKVDTMPLVYAPLPTRNEVVLLEEEDGEIVTFITLEHNKVITECICDLIEFNPIEKYIVSGNVFENTDLRIFNSEIVWKTKNEFQPRIVFPSEWVFIGCDVEDKVLVPQKNMVYDIVVTGKGNDAFGDFSVTAYVSGYEVS